MRWGSGKGYLIAGLALISVSIASILFLSRHNSKDLLLRGEGVLLSLPFDSTSEVPAHLLSTDRLGHPRSSLKLNGHEQFIAVEAPINISNNFSLCFWVNPENTGQNQTLFLKGENCPDGNPHYLGISFEILLTREGTVTARLFAGEGNHTSEYIQMNSTKTIPAGEWSFIIITFDNPSKTFQCFRNGESLPVNQTSKSKPSNFNNIHSSASPLKIGADENYCEYTHQFGSYFTGQIDDVIIFNRTLSTLETEILSGSIESDWLIIAILLLSFAGAVLGILYYQTIQVTLTALSNKYVVVVKVVSLGVLALLMFMFFSHQGAFTNTAYFGGDTWEYQSMAVNLAKGYGLQRFGKLQPFEDYRFDRDDESTLAVFKSEAGRFNDYRTPLYPAFVGGLYKVFGVNPSIVKKVQLLLLVIIASCLPWLAKYFWGNKGFLAGVIAGFIYIYSYHGMAQDILTECLFSFTIFLFLVTQILHEKYNNYKSAAAVGIALGLSLLTRANLLFVPAFYLLHTGYTYWKERRFESLKKASVVLLFIILTVAPWSIYASRHSGKLVILSTQAEKLLLDCNNEFATDGLWHPEWSLDSSSFYRNDKKAGQSPVVRVISFYLQNPLVFGSAMKKKISIGFGPFWALFLTIGIIWINRLESYFHESRSALLWTNRAIQWILTLLFLIIIAQPGSTSTWLTELIRLAMVLSLLVLPLMGRSHPRIPLVLHFIFLNFFLFTLIGYGEPRHNKVIDFAFILIGTFASLDLIYKLLGIQTKTISPDK